MSFSSTVIDYGAGNLRSIERALGAAGLLPRVVSDPADVGRPDLLVLPGQGHFGQVARAFRASGFEAVVREHVAAGRAFLGICVGLQLLLDGSDEAPGEPGLGLLPGWVRRFPAGVAPVPQMGWNRLGKGADFPLLAGVASGAYVYFANSYYADVRLEDRPVASATTEYAGVSFLSAFSIGNVHATQFHPEKSQAVGLRVLGNLAAVARGAAA